MVVLARAILSGERRTLDDGTELVEIDGRWYNADRTNAGRFMREHKVTLEPKTGPSDDRAAMDKLEKLEEALLEGRISEQTYQDLKAKYER